MSIVDSQTTNPHPTGYVEARMTEWQPGTRGAEAPIAEAPRDDGRHQEGLRPPRDPRIIFRHTDGNPTISIRSGGACELAVEPKVWQGEPSLSSGLSGAGSSQDEIKCNLKMGTIECNLHYIPASDGVVLVNMGKEHLSVVPLPHMENGTQHQVHPWGMMIIDSACWRLSDPDSSVELQVLPRPYQPGDDDDGEYDDEEEEEKEGDQQESEPATGAGKRPAEDTPQPAKRIRGSSRAPAGSEAGALVEHFPVQPLDNTSGLIWSTSNPQGPQHQTLQEIVNRITTSRPQSSHSGVSEIVFDDGGGTSVSSVVAVKVPVRLDRSPNNDSSSSSSSTTDGNAYAARAWWAEFSSQRNLQHNRLACLRGFDARTMALHLEYKPHKELGSSRWCAQAGQEDCGYFLGGVRDAICILTHISSAVAYLAEQGIAHNDIRPANILYTEISWPAAGPYQAAEGGAVLVDFGLAGPSDRASSEGSPWYVAPEYMEQGLRGTAADVFALGVVMLYAMRRCVLPESWYRHHGQHREWLVRDVRDGEAGARAAMRNWLDEVGRARDRLEFSDTLYESSEEAELGSLVHSMLLPLADRITSEELAEATSDWDLELELDMDLDLELDLGLDLGLEG